MGDRFSIGNAVYSYADDASLPSGLTLEDAKMISPPKGIAFRALMHFYLTSIRHPSNLTVGYIPLLNMQMNMTEGPIWGNTQLLIRFFLPPPLRMRKERKIEPGVHMNGTFASRLIILASSKVKPEGLNYKGL